MRPVMCFFGQKASFGYLRAFGLVTDIVEVAKFGLAACP